MEAPIWPRVNILELINWFGLALQLTKVIGAAARKHLAKNITSSKVVYTKRCRFTLCYYPCSLNSTFILPPINLPIRERI
ncbi:Tyrosinase [Fusarium oxysporum f. sp. albedinis]|nr:Tyrosinase [Fusarium oxysporum f. sp. albedinis]